MKKDYSNEILESLESIENLKLNGQHEESIDEAQKLLCKDPSCVPALEELADNFVSLDRFSEARNAAEHALKLNQDSYTSHYIIGFINSSEQNWKKAITSLKKANELHPNNPEILRCTGWAIFNSGNRNQGMVILERSLNLDPENSLTLCDLGICYLQTKKFEKALELLKKANEIDPENQRIQECYQAAKGFSDHYTSLKKSPQKRVVQRKSFN